MSVTQKLFNQNLIKRFSTLMDLKIRLLLWLLKKPQKYDLHTVSDLKSKR